MPVAPKTGKKTGIYYDTREFGIKFPKIVDQTLPQAGAEGLYDAAVECMRDTMREEPTVPKLFGHLRRNQVIEKPAIKKGEISIVEGFNSEYATPVHEAPVNLDWTLPGSGPKFLESKLAKNAKKYMGIAAAKMKGAK